MSNNVRWLIKSLPKVVMFKNPYIQGMTLVSRFIFKRKVPGLRSDSRQYYQGTFDLLVQLGQS